MVIIVGLKEKMLKVDKYCCDQMKEEQDNTVVICEEYIDDNFKQKIPGCFLLVPREDEPDYLLINYCPFCGEKIEIVKK